jgi:hypothetical protein
MTHQSEETSLPPSLDSVLDRLSARHLPGDRAAIQAALVEREDQVADFLRLAGQQFGLFPQIVAEVLSQTGLGTPVSTEQRDMIHRQFHALMGQIERAMRGEGPMPQP